MYQIPDETPAKYNEMPEGLEGYWWETDHLVCVPLVIAKAAGTFSKFLKEVEAKQKVVFFPSIVSAKLDAILRAKGYVEAYAFDHQFNEAVDGLARWGTDSLCRCPGMEAAGKERHLNHTHISGVW